MICLNAHCLEVQVCYTLLAILHMHVVSFEVVHVLRISYYGMSNVLWSRLM